MSNHSLENLHRHDRYFLPGGDLYFLSGNDLFRVHSYFFLRESQFFRQALQAPGQNIASKGSSAADAFVLEDVTRDEFEQFLWVFYNETFSLYTTSVQAWGRILRLANLWHFPNVKNLAVSELEKIQLSDIDRIVLYQTHAISHNVLVPIYVALCTREEPLSVQEAEKLGLETAMKVARARECIRSQSFGSGETSPVPGDLNSEQISVLIKRIFHRSSGR